MNHRKSHSSRVIPATETSANGCERKGFWQLESSFVDDSVRWVRKWIPASKRSASSLLRWAGMTPFLMKEI